MVHEDRQLRVELHLVHLPPYESSVGIDHRHLRCLPVQDVEVSGPVEPEPCDLSERLPQVSVEGADAVDLVEVDAERAVLVATTLASALGSSTFQVPPDPAVSGSGESAETPEGRA